MKDIATNLDNRNIETAMDLLILHQKNLDQQILALQEKKRSITERILFYQQAEIELSHIEQPYLKQFPKRNLLFQAWGCQDMTRKQMHISHMNLRNLAHDLDFEVDYGWGALLFDADIQANDPIRHAGAYVRLPDDFDMTRTFSDCQCVVAPAGTYVCMNVYAMPYDTSFLEKTVSVDPPTALYCMWGFSKRMYFRYYFLYKRAADRFLPAPGAGSPSR